jgi:hypothetical protein
VRLTAGRWPALPPQPLLEGGFDLAGERKAARLGLGEDEVAVERDLEAAAAALDQLRLEAESFPNAVRQTDGAGLVVSNDAVLDGQSRGHPNLLPEAAGLRPGRLRCGARLRVAAPRSAPRPAASVLGSAGASRCYLLIAR